MIEESETPEGRAAAAGTSSGRAGAERAGYCQQCGRVLTVDSLRRVGNGVFCEICGAAGNTPTGWSAVPSASPGGRYAPGSGAPTGDEPNPVLAGFLGLIPGVGAMYNGQYAKGVVHLIVFVVLVALADNLNWVLWWFVWGWIFYQAFEAYHTARARRDGEPLPNPFGWNDLGDRMGFGRPMPPVGTRPANPYAPARGTSSAWSAAAGTTAAESNATASAPATEASVPFSYYEPYSTGSPYAAAVPAATQASYATAPPQAPTVPFPSPQPHTPYADTYTGPNAAPGYASPPAPVSQPTLVLGTRRFPVGALWLIGLGALFLLGNLLPEWRLNGRWLVPILLAILAVWTATRRTDLLRSTAAMTQTRPNWAGAFLGPALLLTVAGLLALQDGHVLSLRRSWPVLLVVWGAMLLGQRGSEASLPPSTAVDPPRGPAAGASTPGTGPLGL